ncbi:signal transduction histidine kinase/DNA-binding response OmpR family regulator/CHASE3 domain sensor protein [Epilithonimonas hungarica]|uniref:response regulator n=1 Tax=Epilithonimonas hungarica TaxID=454006 RepID=UPI00278687A7|nr:response regulator [Epilithonimonas hungarica]MDP9955819.1 signal transduction histidine kinase/DNA-binding response OmpR family regulator/CHASE3 domain sensor protein [Epilithonimonas hungarica]
MPKKIIRNLQFGVGLSLLILLASSLASYLSIQNQMNNREKSSQSRRSITAVKDVLIALLDAETGNRGYQLTGKESFLEPYNRSVSEYAKAIDRAKEIEITDKLQLKRVEDLQQNANNSMENLRQFVINRRNGLPMTQEQITSSKVYMDRCRQIVADFVKYEESQLVIKNKALNNSSSTTVLFIIFSAIAAVVVTIFFYTRLRNDLIRRDRLEKELMAKDLEISKRVSIIKQVTSKVASGDYSVRLSDRGEDELADIVESLNYMTQSLKTSFEQINENEWRQKGLVLLNESLVGNKTVKEVTDNALDHFVSYADCVNGAIYLYEDERLRLYKAFGLEEHMKKSFLPGEGMVGQTFVKEKTNVFNDLGDKDFVASFASSKIKIQGIILVPIMLGRQIFGILELGATHNFDAVKIDYFNEGARNIATALSAARSREKEQRLLEETQAQSEELQVQHAELENLNTELEAQTQKLQASEEELRVQQEELLQTNTELEERSKALEEKNHLIAERNIEIQKKAEELALSTQYKSEFLANMSHELRTPLNSILLLSRLMAENPEENLNEDQIESAKVIQSSGTSLLTLIDEILDLAKIESGKMNLVNEPILLDDVTRDLKNLFMPIVKEKGVQFNIYLDDSITRTLSTDRLRLDQVLRNLLSNAFKFTKEGSVDLNIYECPKNSEFIVFSVKDTGMGIPEEKQKLIFEAFQQADGSTQRKFGGTGLGLSISREIAKLLGGKITLESESGKGSEFSLIIPKQPSDSSGIISNEQSLIDVISQDVEEIKTIIETDDQNIASIAHLEIPEEIEDDRNNISKGDKVILIIEDDTHFAKALLKYAHVNDYKAVIIVRGDYALPAALEYKPVAILLDIQLPVKDGWQVMNDLKTNSQTRPVPVHMMSSLQAKRESLMRGAIDFIDKPVAMEEMNNVFKKIEDALKRSPQKVLIVEENAQHAKALSYFLGNYNISLSVENNVEDSVKAFQKDNVDCVIVDVGSARGSSYQIVERIKSYEGLENLPVIIFTERNLTQSEELKIKQYADSIVVKTAHSYQRILDEISLFLHLVEENNQSGESGRVKNLGTLTETLSGKKILITDDDVRNIFSLSKALEKYKVEVVLAMDGKQALDKIEENPDIDVILMDMMMPEMDGYDTIREIRKMPDFKDLPIIAVTAKSMIGDRDKCIQAGASDYITKPVDIDQLLSLLRVWLYES